MLNVWKYGHLCANLTFIGYLCEMCSMCENMAICVQIWLSLDICVKYAQCAKIWPFVCKFDFYWIFVWNMLNVWKYGNFWWILYWIWQLFSCWSGKGRRALTTHVLYLGKGRRTNETRVSHHSKGRRALHRRVSLLLNMQKKEYLQIILHRILIVPTHLFLKPSMCRRRRPRPGLPQSTLPPLTLTPPPSEHAAIVLFLKP
jgi:hypothetical protein